jgi:hypothetical protein
MSELPAIVVCDGLTKKGEPCKRPVGENRRQCWRHAVATRGEALDASKVGAEKRDEALLIELRRQVLKDPEAVVRPILEALAATKSYVTNGELVTVADHATRIKAFETVADRLLGKPMQPAEITGADGGPLLALLRVAAESRDGG